MRVVMKELIIICEMPGQRMKNATLTFGLSLLTLQLGALDFWRWPNTKANVNYILENANWTRR